MIKTLIISYYYPPVNHVAAQRGLAFQQYFPGFGIEPLVATRHWLATDTSWESYFEGRDLPLEIDYSEFGKVLRLPFRSASGYKLAHHLGRPVQQAYIFGKSLIGNTQPEIDIFGAFFRPLLRYLRSNPVDLIVATFQPASALRLAHRLSKELGIQYVADFRDVWNPSAFAIQNSSVGIRQSILRYIQEFHIKRWLRGAALVSAVNQPIIDRLKTLCPDGTRFVRVTNGFDEEKFRQVEAKSVSSFTISIVGTVYPVTDLTIFFAGIREFLKGKSAGDVRLNFVGAGAVESSVRKLRENLPEEFLSIKGRVPHEEAIGELKSSHVLFDVGWKGYKGITPGKIFDYLGARRNILIAPSDHDTMEKIVTETGAGRTADTIEEFVSVLEGWYREWKDTGEIRYGGIPEKIAYYTRENQTAILAREILKLDLPSGGDPE